MRERTTLAAAALLAAGALLGWRASQAQLPAPGPADAAGRDGPLDTLDWMVGDWVDADDVVTAEFSCHYTRNGAFLVRSFRIGPKDAVRMSGMQLIAWDPVRETIRSWLPRLAASRVPVLPRINALDTDWIEADLEAVVGPHVLGISVGKVRSAGDIAAISPNTSGVPIQFGTTQLTRTRSRL